MEDKIIFNGLYAYQFRLDLLNEDSSGNYNRIILSEMPKINEMVLLQTYCQSKIKTSEQQNLLLMLESYFIHYYIFLEVGLTTRKLHFQGIIWSENKYSNKQLTAIKSKCFKKQRLIPNAISITSAKKIMNLASYVSKSSDRCLLENTLTDLQISKIPSWKKRKNDREFKKIINTTIKSSIDSGDSINVFLEKIIRKYWAEGRQQPTRMTCIKYLGIFHPEYAAQDYLNTLNIHPHSNWSSY